MFQDERIVRNDMVVSLEYTLQYEDGETIADSNEDGLLAFIQGRGHVFPALEGAIEGMREGEELNLTLQPEDAYGEYEEDAVEVLPIEAFPAEPEIEVGMEVALYDEETGAEFEAIVAEITDEGVIVDLNHPLAGEVLKMWLRVAEIRAATDEELEHDHVHDDDHAHELDDESSDDYDEQFNLN